MLLHEKQIVYWSVAYLEVDETLEEPELRLDEFILGPFDWQYLSEQPPESNWSDWFPPPPRMLDWELDDLSDWVELEAKKCDSAQDTFYFQFNGKEHYET